MLRKLAGATIWSLSLLVSPRLLWAVDQAKKRIYSRALERGFKRVGTGSIIEFPVILAGQRYISIGKHLKAFAGLQMEALDRYLGHVYTPEVVIGDNVIFNRGCHVACVNRIEIGDNVIIASRVFITDHSHGDISAEALDLPPIRRKVVSKGPVVIEDNVWIGEGVSIMPNVRIGRNSIVGTNSVVTRDIPPNSVACGVPARTIRTL